MNTLPTPNDVQAVRDNLKKAEEAKLQAAADEALLAVFCDYAKNGRLHSTYLCNAEVRAIVMERLLNAGWEEGTHYSVSYYEGEFDYSVRSYWTISFSF